MDYTHFFSDDVASFMRSPVREIFRRVDLSSIYSFAGGYPDASTFPLREMESLAAAVVARYGPRTLQYGATQGVPELREALLERFRADVADSGAPGAVAVAEALTLDNIQITTSSQQGIDVCTRIFVNPGDVVLTFSPTYLGALQSFRSYRAQVVDISEASKEQLRSAKVIYVIPDFQNPSGVTMTLEERESLVSLARRHDLIIVEDSPYRELRYEGQSVPAIYLLAPERTVYLGSFSKIFAPGLRLGWMIGPAAILEQVYVCKQALDLCPPVFDQYMAAEYLCSGALDANLVRTRDLYRSKRDMMLSLLERYMPEGVSWTHPEGGLFLFVTLPEGCDTVAMYDRALSAGVAYVAGSFFYPDGSHRNTMRLNFSFVDASRMEAGIRLLSQIISESL